MRIKSYVDNQGKHRARILAGNNEQLAKTRKGYESKELMLKDLADDLDGDSPTARRADNDEWTWTSKAMVCSETYKSKYHTRKMIKLIFGSGK